MAKTNEKVERKAPQRLPYEVEINATRILKEIPEMAKIKAAIITLPGASILETIFGGSEEHDKKILRTLYFGNSKPVTKDGKVVQTFNLAGNAEKIQSIFDSIPTSELTKRAVGSIKATSDKILRDLIRNGKAMNLTAEQVIMMAKISLQKEDPAKIEEEVKNAYDDTKVIVEENKPTKQQVVLQETIKPKQEPEEPEEPEEDEGIPSEGASALADEQEELDVNEAEAEGSVETPEELTDEPSDW